MKINLTQKHKIIGGILLIFVLISIINIINNRSKSNQKNTPLPSVSTPSSTITQIPINPVELTEEWNKQFNESLEEYSKSSKARIDKSLAYIRKNSPIIETGFQIKYDYSNATYTITIEPPTKENKEKLISWLSEIDITEKDLTTVRVKWITEP